MGVLARLVLVLVVGPHCWAAAGRCRAAECGPNLFYLLDLVTPTFKTPSMFDGFLLELHLSLEVLQFLLPKALRSPRGAQMIPDEPR